MKSLAFVLLASLSIVASAQNHAFVGNRFVVGDTAWFGTHLVTATSITITGGGVTKTRMEQDVFHHQFTTSHADSHAVVVTVYDSIRLTYGGDTVVVKYNSTNPADSAAAFNMMVYPLKALIGHPLTAYIHNGNIIDSIHGLDAVIHDASLKLERSAAIAQLKSALNEDMVKDLMQQSFANLPNKELTDEHTDKFKRARMVGRTQFMDEVVTQLMKATADTAWLMRITYTQIASPTIVYAGKLCVIDSTYGTGDQQIVFDIPRGVILSSHETFSNFLRAGIANTNTSVVQINELKADVELLRYATFDKKASKKKK